MVSERAEVLDPAELGRRMRALRLAHREWYVHQAAARLGLDEGVYVGMERGIGVVEWIEEQPAARARHAGCEWGG